MPTTQDQVATAILEILAAHMKTETDALRKELVAKGNEMPIDSLAAIETLLELEARFEVDIPIDAQTERASRTVLSLAKRVAQLCAIQHSGVA